MNCLIFVRTSAIATLTAALLILLPSVAQAERDTFFTGTGRDGTLTVASNTIVNLYTTLAASVNTGDTSVSVGSATGIAAGDLVMLHQTTGLTPVPASGAAGPIDLTTNVVGRWELARVASVSSTTLTLTKPLVNGFVSTGCQVLRVPEYTSVTINSSRSILPPPWNGTTGGVVALLVSGTLTNNGLVTATSRGFRGGVVVIDVSGTLGATGLDEPAATGAQKGEGVAPTRYGATQTGRGRVANGAGGGVAYKAGGGGGGNGGAGGQGGNSDGNIDGNRAIGGQGGTALSYNLLNHLVPGGGGGAGHATDASGTLGGGGGGVVFVRAGAIAGTGTYTAIGSLGGGTLSDAASGGGAGGSLYLRVAGSAVSGTISAVGGAGGSVNGASSIGPGGGGGGGRILFQKGSGTAAPSGTAVNGGAAGTQQDGINPNWNATAGAVGSVTTLTGPYVSPTTPSLTVPANNGTAAPTTSLSGTTTAGAVVHILLDGTEIGAPTADGSGNFTFTPGSPLTMGAHSVVLYAEDVANASFSSDSTPSSFTVASADANLTGLVPSAGTLSPVFSSGNTSYTATVTRAVSNVTLTPTLSDANATVAVRVNGGSFNNVASGSPSSALALNLGSNTLDVRVTAQDGATTRTYTVTMTRWTYLEGWRNTYFSTVANSGNAADTATPKGDGLPNLLKFALGMNPSVSGVSPVSFVKNGGTLDFSYPRSVQATMECTFIVEWSDTLLNNDWSSTGVTEQILSDNGTLQQVKASIPAGTGERRFVRLRVTSP